MLTSLCPSSSRTVRTPYPFSSMCVACGAITLIGRAATGSRLPLLQRTTNCRRASGRGRPGDNVPASHTRSALRRTHRPAPNEREACSIQGQSLLPRQSSRRRSSREMALREATTAGVATRAGAAIIGPAGGRPVSHAVRAVNVRSRGHWAVPTDTDCGPSRLGSLTQPTRRARPRAPARPAFRFVGSAGNRCSAATRSATKTLSSDW